MCIDARKTSLTGVQNSKKNRLAATRLVDDAPPWKKARSAAGMWGKNVFFFVMLLPRGKILISSAKYWFLGMRILKSSNTTWQLWLCYIDEKALYRVAQKERNSRYSRFSGLCSNQQLLSSLCWIEHLFPIIITSRSSNLVENFLFYETFLMDCHFRDLPDFQSFEAQWQINGKSQKWQSIRNYS